MIRLTIDGKTVETAEGRTILEAARENGIYIPTLCYHANLLPLGSCRICIVEVDGYANPMASCQTAAQDGMSVRTGSDKLFAMRQDYLKLILAYHPLECPICDAGGECDLQDLVFAHGIEKADLSVTRRKKIEGYATPLIKYFENRCVLCLRCIQACREVSGRHVLDLVETGIDAKMAPANGRNCVSCGECLFVCPVGALTENLSPVKARLWQVERHFTTCPHCGFGCTFEMDVRDGDYVTDVIQNVNNMPNRGSLCVMGRFGYDFVNHEARIDSARAGDTELGSDAPAAAAERLRSLDAEGKGIGFVVSPRATNEEIFLVREIAGRLKKSALASSAWYHTGRVREAYGNRGLSYPYSYDRLMDADLIIIAGADLLSNNHVLGDRVRDAYKLKGSRIIVIDPAPAALSNLADSHLKVAPGKDAALFRALVGFLAQQLPDGCRPESNVQDVERALEEAGVDGREFARACALIGKAANVAVIFGSGISASDASLDALLDVAARLGTDKKGLLMPVARAANAVGAASILNGVASPHELIADASIKALFLYEENPLRYTGTATAAAIAAKEFVLVCDALPTTVMEHAHMVVPTGVFTEKEGTFFAGDGAIRRLSRVTHCESEAAYPGFTFLSQVLVRLGGPSFRSPHDVTAYMKEKGLIAANGGREEAPDPERRAEAGRTTNGATPASGNGGYVLIMRDMFSNHHLADTEIYSKGVAAVYRHPGYPVSEDKLCMSPADAQANGLSEGDVVQVSSKNGTVSKPLSVKEGLKPGVLEYIVFRDRKEASGLIDAPAKWVEVKVQKG